MMAGKFEEERANIIEIWGAIIHMSSLRNWGNWQQRQHKDRYPGTTDPNPGHTLVALDTCGAHTVVP